MLAASSNAVIAAYADHITEKLIGKKIVCGSFFFVALGAAADAENQNRYK